jgi:hypothetical protein
MMNRLISLAWLALLLCAPAPALAEWREASSRHFLVYSEGSEQSVRDFATKLEKFDKAMRLRLGFHDEELGPGNRVTVFVVDNIAAVQRLARARGSDIAGFYSGRAGTSLAVVPRASGSGRATDLNPATILLHEYSHHLMLQNATAAYPAWFREGFAEFYSTARFEKDGAIGFGAAANHRGWALLGMPPLPIELLFDPTRRRLSQAEWEATDLRPRLAAYPLSDVRPGPEGTAFRLSECHPKRQEEPRGGAVGLRRPQGAGPRAEDLSQPPNDPLSADEGGASDHPAGDAEDAAAGRVGDHGPSDSLPGRSDEGRLGPGRPRYAQGGGPLAERPRRSRPRSPKPNSMRAISAPRRRRPPGRSPRTRRTSTP